MPWLSSIGISAVAWMLVLVAIAVIGLASGEDDPQMPDPPKFEPSYKTHDKAPKSGSNVYYGKDGLCGWWNGKAYEKPLLNYTNPFAPPEEEGNGYYDEGMNRFCLYQFQRIAMQPVCGDPWYSRVKYCTMVQFYENKLPSVPANADKVLVMVDGCAVCGKKIQKDDMEVSIALVNTWPAGSLFTKCKEEKHTAGDINMKLKSSPYFESQIDKVNDDQKVSASKENLISTTFSFPAVLRQRKCKGITSEDPPQKKYQGMMLEVKHKCTGDDSEDTFNVPLDDITPSDFRNNMVELRGIMLILEKGNNKWAQYRMENYAYQNANAKPVYDNMKDDDGDEKKKRKKKK